MGSALREAAITAAFSAIESKTADLQQQDGMCDISDPRLWPVTIPSAVAVARKKKTLKLYVPFYCTETWTRLLLNEATVPIYERKFILLGIRSPV